MSEYLVRTPDSSLLRDFPDEVLAPPKDHLLALAATRRGDRPVDPLAALVRHANRWEEAARSNQPTVANPTPARRDWRRAA